MNPIDCSRCGSTELVEQDGRLVCLYCRTSFLVSPSPSAKVSTVGLEGDIEMLLRKCEQDPLNRRRYAGLVLDLDPTNEQAERYLR